jgi:hypothetical protein
VTTAVAIDPASLTMPSSGSVYPRTAAAGGSPQWVRSALGTASLDWAPAVTGALAGIRAECGRANWDGEGATPVAEATLDLTLRFLDLLYALVPRALPAPEITPEPDGDVDVSWYVDSTRMLNVSVGPTGRLAFAAQLGPLGSRHGTVRLDVVVRERRLDAIEDIVRHLSSLYPGITGRRA